MLHNQPVHRMRNVPVTVTLCLLMNRSYIYPRLDPLVLVASIIGIFACAILAKGFLTDALSSKDVLYRIIAAIIGLFFALGAVWILVENFINLVGARRIITEDESLTIQNLSSVKTIKWEDIMELGTYTAGFGHHRNRRYYVKAKESGDKRIDLCTQHLENLKELIDTIFLRATNAKFVIAENVARIPFTKQIQLLPWDRRDQSLY